MYINLNPYQNILNQYIQNRTRRGLIIQGGIPENVGHLARYQVLETQAAILVLDVVTSTKKLNKMGGERFSDFVRILMDKFLL